jgi:predicted unusual protein kinase regulating ubiquinone biosynthesis (AarF/ABC1/UbiB family)
VKQAATHNGQSEAERARCRLFQEFNVEPLAAASLGQVHLAKLWDGRKVVVKVQRPGLKSLFDIDLEALGQIATALDKQDSSRDFVSIYKECAEVLYGEIEYLKEVRMSAATRSASMCCGAMHHARTKHAALLEAAPLPSRCSEGESERQ